MDRYSTNNICNLANDLMRSFSTEIPSCIIWNHAITDNRFAYYDDFQLTRPAFKQIFWVAFDVMSMGGMRDMLSIRTDNAFSVYTLSIITDTMIWYINSTYNNVHNKLQSVSAKHFLKHPYLT